MTVRTLLDETRSLASDAVAVYAGGPHDDVVRSFLTRLDEPLRVAIAGKVKAGKSTLLNALVGESLAPTDAGECTRIVTWYRAGTTYRASFERRDGTMTPARFSRESGGLEVHLDDTDPDEVSRLVIDWPASALADMTLIDTPGIGSLTQDAEDRTRQFLSPSEEVHTPADAVLYLMRHLHASDARFLETFHDDGQARAAPINAIGVLSRADEIGGAQADALRTAGRIAERYRIDPNVRRLCQTVVPLAGLVAQAGTTLTEAEFRAIAKLGALDVDDAESLLLSADRFVDAPSPLALAREERSHLVSRLGIFGLRLANALVRAGRGPTSRELAAELRSRSGIEDLTRELATHFSARRDVLKARSTLLALDEMVRRHPVPGSERLGHDIERVLAGAHELAELRLLTAVRSGTVALSDDEVAEVERLVGGPGRRAAERVGLEVDATPTQVRLAALGAHQRWAMRAESPLSSAGEAAAARVVQRSYETVIMACPA